MIVWSYVIVALIGATFYSATKYLCGFAEFGNASLPNYSACRMALLLRSVIPAACFA